MQHIKAGRQNKERTVISDLIVCALFAVKKRKLIMPSSERSSNSIKGPPTGIQLSIKTLSKVTAT